MTGANVMGSDAFSGASNRFDPNTNFSASPSADPIDIGGGTTAAPLTPEVPDLSTYNGEQETSSLSTFAKAAAAGGIMGHGFKEGNWLDRVQTNNQERLGKWSRDADQLARRRLDDAFRPQSEVDAKKQARKAEKTAEKAAKRSGRAPFRGPRSGGAKAARAAAVGARNMASKGTNALGRTAAARAAAPVATRLGARALAMAAAAAVPGPGWAIAIGIGVTIALELVFNDKFRTWVANGIRGGGLDINEPPSPPETHFLPMARDDRDEPIRAVDERITKANTDFINIDPKQHRLWDIDNPGIDRLEPMQGIVDKINEVSEGLNTAVADVGGIYAGGSNTTWVGDQLEAMTPELELMSSFGDVVGAPMVESALFSAKASNDVFQAIREANAISRDAIARSQGKWLSSVPMVSGFGRATVDENLMTDNADKIENKINESVQHAAKVEEAAKRWGVLKPPSATSISGSGPHFGNAAWDSGSKQNPGDDPENAGDNKGGNQGGAGTGTGGGGGFRPIDTGSGSRTGSGSGGSGGSPWPGGGGDSSGSDDGDSLTDPFGDTAGAGDPAGEGLGEYGSGLGGEGAFGDPTTGFGTGGDGGAFGDDTGSPFGDTSDPFDGGQTGGLGVDPTTGTSGFGNPFGDDSFDDIFDDETAGEDPFGAEDGPGPLGVDISENADGGLLDDGTFGGDSDDGFGPVVEGEAPAGEDGEFDPFATGEDAEDTEGELPEDGLFGDAVEGGTAPPAEGGGGGFGSETGGGSGGGSGSAGGGGEGFGSVEGGDSGSAFGSETGSDAGSDAGEGAFGSDGGDPAGSSLFEGTDLSEDPAGSPWGSTGEDTAEMDPERTVEVNGEPVQFVSPETADMIEAVQDPAVATEGIAFRELAAQHGLELPPEGNDIGTPVSPAEMQPGDVLSSEGKQYMYIGGEDAMDLSTGETHPLADVAIFSGEHEGIFRLPGAEGEDLVPQIGGASGDHSDGGVTAEQMSNTSGGDFSRTDEAPIGMGAGQNAPGGASDSGVAAGGSTSAAGTSSIGDNAAVGDATSQSHSGGSAGGGEGGISEVPYEGREFGGDPNAETLGPDEGDIDAETVGGESSATSSLGSGGTTPGGLDPSHVTGGS